MQCALINTRLSDEITISGDGQGMAKVTIQIPYYSFLDSIGNVIGLMLTPSIQSTYTVCEDISVRKINIIVIYLLDVVN